MSPGPRGERAREAAAVLARRAARLAGRATAPARPLPEFAVVGAKRGGTTSLYHLLLDHPQVLPLFPGPRTPGKRGPTKGTHHFVPGPERPLGAYRSWFPTAATRRLAAARLGAPVVTGEASPYYLFHPLAPARVHAALPDLKVVALLRDPVERTSSHHREQVRNGVERLSLADALAAEPERLAGEEERILADPAYVSRAHEDQSYARQSYYGRCLQRWLALYPRAQVLVLASEDLYAAPQEAYDRLTDFLGLRRHRLRRVPRLNAAPPATVDPALAARLRASFADDVALLERLTGQRMPWPRADGGRAALPDERALR